MTVNHAHYIPENLDPKVLALINDPHARITEPLFEGQGCSKQVGSDCYGYYITKIVDPKFIGLVHADEVMHSDWTEGSEDCSMPANKTPSIWLKKFRGKWYEASAEGQRFNGRHFRIGFNGAYAYRDPSF